MNEGRSAGAEARQGEAAILTVHVAEIDYTAHPDDGAVMIGRELPAQIRLNEPGISRMHVRLEPAGDHWTLTDTGSRNGTFLDGRRIESIAIDRELDVYLGNPEGVLVRLCPSVSADTGQSPVTSTGADGDQPHPDIARVGAAVAARCEELGLSQRELTDDHLISHSVLVRFQRGLHWPPERARAKIEEHLHWEPGTMARIRAGEPVPDEESTEAITPTVQVAVAIDAAEIAMRGIYTRAAMLPVGDDPGFATAVAGLLSELRRLETSLTNAARTATGRPELAVMLGDVRQTYTDLMRRAARAPTSTLGQRLHVARHRRRLTVQEAANAAGVTDDDVINAESELPLPGPAAATLQRFVDILEQGSERP